MYTLCMRNTIIWCIRMINNINKTGNNIFFLVFIKIYVNKINNIRKIMI